MIIEQFQNLHTKYFIKFRFQVLFFISLSIFIISNNICFANPEIFIKEKNFVKDSQSFFLEDIANFRDMPMSKVKMLKKIQIAQAPSFGQSLMFTGNQLAKILRPHMKIFSNEERYLLTLKIPKQIFIENKGFFIAEQVVKEKLLNHFSKSCSTCSFRLERLAIPKMENIHPKATWEVKMENPHLKGDFSFPIEVILPNNGLKRTFWLSGRLKLFRSLAIARRYLAANTIIKYEDIEYVEKEVLDANQNLTDAKEIIGYKIRNPISAGEIIKKSDLMRELLVKSGETIKLLGGNGDWQISTLAIARQSGYIGDVIHLVNQNTQKEISGIIVDKGVVRVE